MGAILATWMTSDDNDHLVVACCKSSNGITKVRWYRFRKRSEPEKLTYYLELKKIQ